MKFKLLMIMTLAAVLVSCSSEKKTEKQPATQQPTTAQAPKDKLELTNPEDGDLQTKVDIKYTPSDIQFDLNGKPGRIGGIIYTPASQWVDHGSSGKVEAYYSYGPLLDDTDSSTMEVYFYSDHKKNSYDVIQENLYDQMALLDGRNPRTGSIKYDIFVNGMTVHMLSIYGIYEVNVGGNQKIEKSPYRLVGAIVDAPNGNVLFKLTGPDYTAKIMIEAFMSMINSIKVDR